MDKENGDNIGGDTKNNSSSGSVSGVGGSSSGGGIGQSDQSASLLDAASLFGELNKFNIFIF